MKSKLLFFIFLICLNQNVLAESVFIESKSITLKKSDETSIFKDEVKIRTYDNNNISSEYAEYDKKKGIIKLRKNIIATDIKNNIIRADAAEYNEINKIFKSIGPTRVTTSDNYLIEGNDIIFESNKKTIKSYKSSKISDLDGNQIFLENFEYNSEENIFKSIGYIKIQDNLGNNYEFSQIYIDTNVKEILGTDIKAFMNSEGFKIDERNKPRIFSNSVKLDKQKSVFNKSVFTLCDYRKNDKCPPWTIQSSEMLHDRKKKTIYYENAVVKVYDIPIFYFPKLSHPDPSVDRRSGFLVSTFNHKKNLGYGARIPYYFAIDKDKNFTLTSGIYASEHPIFIGEYHQAFKDSEFIANFGYTEGYKNTTDTKQQGSKRHLFAKYLKNFVGKNNSKNSLDITIQNISDDKYLKLYDVKSRLIDNATDNLESYISFEHENEDIFVGMKATIYETLKEDYSDKYEYILPEITIDKNLFNNNTFGSLDMLSTVEVHKYDTNKLTNFIVNDLNWSSKNIFFNTGIKSKFIGNLRNINYEAKNVELYKEDATSELFGALGFLSKLNMKKTRLNSDHFLTPKLLVRYSPGSMRNEMEGDGIRLDPINAFNLDRMKHNRNYETGLSSTLGFDYEIKKNDVTKLDFSVAQVINDKENNKMDDITSMDEKLSDLVGSAKYDINEKFSLNYNFALDQNYSELNYNDLGLKMNFNSTNLYLNYLQENKHIGDQDYIKTKIDYKSKNDNLLSFETKRNLITNSAEFYNLSYEYVNDCLRAGLVYRREFYNDSELEPENSLMFKVTLTPFGNLNTPAFSQ